MSSGFTTSVLFLAAFLVSAAHSKADFNERQNMELIEAHFADLGHNVSFDFRHISTSHSADGTEHHKYQLLLNRIPVESRLLYLHMGNGVKSRISENISTDPEFIKSYQKTNTIQKVIADADLKKLTYIPSEEKGNLIIAQSTIEPDPGTGDLISVYSDPFTGKVVRKVSHRCDLDSAGIAHTHYMGVHTITTNHSHSGQFILENTSGLTSVKDLSNNTNPVTASSITDADNFWDNALFATDAFVATTAYRQMLSSRFNRNSLDDNGMPLRCLVNYGNNVNNAFWNGQHVVYGAPSQGNQAMTTYDITGHEFTHGMIQHSAGLIYSYESGAINEALADIFGMALEYDVTGILNWEIGEETGNTLRSLSDPSLYDQPVYYRGTDWYFGSGDNGGVHINSGVINRWFHLVSEGGQGIDEKGRQFDVDGIGFDESLQIIYDVMNNYLFPDDDMTRFRERVIDHAINAFGRCSNEFYAIHEAFKAVGIGPTVDSAPVSARTGTEPLIYGLLPSEITKTAYESNSAGYQSANLIVSDQNQNKFKCYSINSRLIRSEELTIIQENNGVFTATLSSGRPLTGSPYHIISVSGKLIVKGIADSHRLNLDQLNGTPGVYILIVDLKDLELVQKFVVR